MTSDAPAATKGLSKSKDRKGAREESTEGQNMTVEELDIKIAELERTIRKHKNQRDKSLSSCGSAAVECAGRL